MACLAVVVITAAASTLRLSDVLPGAQAVEAGMEGCRRGLCGMVCLHPHGPVSLLELYRTCAAHGTCKMWWFMSEPGLGVGAAHRGRRRTRAWSSQCRLMPRGSWQT